MAQEQTIIKRFDLSNGFVTEFTELNFPENAAVDESNMTIENDGSRKRRKGVDYENNHSFHTVGADAWQSGDAVTVFNWRGAGGDPDTNFVVVQVGLSLHMYDRDSSSFSDNREAIVDLSAKKQSAATNTQVRQTRVDMVSGNSRLFVAGRYLEPFYVEWSGSVFNVSIPTIEQRDFEGLDDGLDTDERPNSLSSSHDYNLQNQGWDPDDISTFHSDQSAYPSNADIWHFGKFIDTGSSGRESFDPAQVVIQDFGNTRAPSGHFLKSIYDDIGSASTTTTTINIDDFTHDGSTGTVTVNTGHTLSAGDSFTIDLTSFDYDNSFGGTQTYTYDEESYTVSSVVDSQNFNFSHTISDFSSFNSLNATGNFETSTVATSVTSTNERPTSVAFFAGRVWWAGIEEEDRQGKVYFSQILENEDDIGKCYQAADPTSEHISDLVDTDGGVLTIAEMGRVKKMEVVGKNLVLFADNGVWNIGPGEQGFFTATSFSVRKISNIEVASKDAIVLAEGTPVVWAYQGIYGFGEDQVSGFLNAQSLSVNTIQSFYRDILDEAKDGAAVTYDDVSKKFYWFYSTDGNKPGKYNRCLLFDARQEAFQKYEIDTIADGPFIAGATTTLGFDNQGEKVKLFTVRESDGAFTFSEFNEDSFHDWKTHEGTGLDAEAYVVTGYETGGEAGRSKQTPVMTFLFRKTETGTDSNGDLINPGSCMMQARWDWTNSANSNKWNPERQVYRLRRNYFPGSHPSNYEDGYPVVWSRNKVRGRGNAFNMKLRSEEAHDLHIIGWQITMTGGTTT